MNIVKTKERIALNGIKRALLIGINYYAYPQNQLYGCINDVTSIKDMLQLSYEYKPENIILMSDNLGGDMMPTKNNIINKINNIVALTKPGDTLFFHYSGHGTSINAQNNNEANNITARNKDDCICPCDFGNYSGDTGFIRDDLLRSLIVDKVPAGARVRAFFDCCFSGSVFDLPYVWKYGNQYYTEHAVDKYCDDIIMVSGCRDDQTSADAWNDQKKEAMGALTMSIIKVLANTNNVKTTWKEFVLVIRHFMLSNSYQQIPMLSTGNKLLGNALIDL